MNTTMKRLIYILVFSFYFISYILPLGVPDLYTPDETRYAEIPREMIVNGDWVVPKLNGLRYFEKPVLGYWVHAASLILFGENTFAARLPSAISAGLSALLIFLILRSVSLHNKEYLNYAPGLTALIFLSCFEVFGVGNVAVLDNLFSFLLTATITAFYFASEEKPGSSKELLILTLSGIACGIAFLTKGFLAFAIPVLVISPYLLLERRYKDLIRMSWVPLLTAILVILPWGILIHMREADFWNFFFWNEHIRRFMGDNSQHQKTFYYFVLNALGMFIPWVFMAPAAVKGLMQQLKNSRPPESRLIKLSICWFALPFLFLSSSSGKLLTYILPCFPPFAILMFYGLVHSQNKGQNRLFNWGLAATGIFFGLILFALLYIKFIGINNLDLFRQPWKPIMLANSLIFICILCLWAIKSSERYYKILLTGCSPIFFFFLIHFVIPDTLAMSKFPGIILNKYHVSNNTIVISDENTISAACWYLKRSDIYLINDGGELNYGLAYPDSRLRLIDINSVEKFINENRGNIVLTVRAKNLVKWKNQLPDAKFQDDSGPKGFAFLRF